MSVNYWVSWSNYRPYLTRAHILRWYRLLVVLNSGGSVNHHWGGRLSLMLCHVLFLELVALGHTLLKDNRRPFPLRCLIKTKHISFTHEVRQLIIIGPLVSCLLKQLWMLLYSSWYAKCMEGSTAGYVTPSIVLSSQKTTSLMLSTRSYIELTWLVIEKSLWLLTGVCQLSLIITTRPHATPSFTVEIELCRICIGDKFIL